MPKPSEIFNKISFRTKLVLSYLLLITIPISVTGVLIYKQFLSSLNERSSSMIEKRLEDETKNINTTLDYIESIGYHLSSNTTLSSFLYENTSVATDLYDALNNNIYPMLNMSKNANPYISNISIFTYNKNIPEVGVFYQAPKYENESWFMDVLNNTHIGSPFWEELHKQRDYRVVKRHIDTRFPVYSLFYIMNPAYASGTSYLELELYLKPIFSSLINSTIGKDGFFSVIDHNGTIVLENDNNALLESLIGNEEFLKSLSQSHGEYMFSFGENDYFAQFSEIKRLGCYIIGIVPTSDVTELFDKPKRNYAITIIVTFACLLLLAFWLSRLLTKKIWKISNAFYRFQEGNFDIQIPVKGEDELDKLAMDFNTMAYNMNQLINKVYKAEIAQKHAELFALQAQIKPHFIYNTLESLKMLAELHDEEKIADSLASLGNIMRQNNSIGRHLIEISTEVDNLTDYVKLQNLTNNDRINLSFSLPDDIMKFKILNLVLQPIVENSIKHGLRIGREPLNIKISGYTDGSDLYLTVKDDGKGIGADRLKELNEIINREPIVSDKQETGGIGLANVNKRIKLYFGNNYGVNLKSEEGKGTEVMIRIPAMS
mgnify:FL=1